MQPEYDREALREMLKEVLQEFLEERKGVFYEVLVEVMEDLSLSRAITEGDNTYLAEREEVMHILSGRT